MYIHRLFLTLFIGCISIATKASIDTLEPVASDQTSYAGHIQFKLAPVVSIWGEFPLFLEIMYSKQWSVELRGGLNYSLFRTIDDFETIVPARDFKRNRTPSLGYSAGLGLRRYPFDFGGPFQGFYYEFRADYLVFKNTILVEGFGYPEVRVFNEKYTRVNGQINVGFGFRLKQHLLGELSLGMGATHVTMDGYQYIITGPLQIFIETDLWWMRPLITSSFKLNYCLSCALQKKNR